MKYLAGIFLICLLLAFPVQAAVFPCSSDPVGTALTCTGCENDGLILVKTIPSGAMVTLDPGLSTTYTSPSPSMLGETPGIHSFTVSMAGYQDYSGQFTICTKLVTYATVELVPGTNPTPTFARLRTFVPLATITTPPATGTTTLPVPTATTAAVSGETSSGSPDDTGSISVTSTPSGAVIFLDGVQKAVSPAVIPGLSPGDHTVQLKMEGYKDLSTSIRIKAGMTSVFSSGLVPVASSATPVATAPADTVTTVHPDTAAPVIQATPVPTTAKSPGFAIISGMGALTVVLVFRRTTRQG